MKKNSALYLVKISMALTLVLTTTIVTSCEDQSRVYDYFNNPTIQNLTSYQRRLLSYTEKAGIQMIKQGMQFTFIIPVDTFFSKDTGDLKEDREKDLDALGAFIQSYSGYFTNPHVRVTGYTDKVWLMPARSKLSWHYANTIATALQESGVDRSIMTVRGDAANHPIASNQYPMGTAFNRRIEVVVMGYRSRQASGIRDRLTK